jgi:hypothetical protein
MRYVDKSKTSAELGHMRCLSIIGSEEEDAKDNTGLLSAACGSEPGVIKFKTEAQAVKRVLECFENRGNAGKISQGHRKTIKKAKKVAKKAKKKGA